MPQIEVRVIQLGNCVGACVCTEFIVVGNLGTDFEIQLPLMIN